MNKVNVTWCQRNEKKQTTTIVCFYVVVVVAGSAYIVYHIDCLVLIVNNVKSFVHNSIVLDELIVARPEIGQVVLVVVVVVVIVDRALFFVRGVATMMLIVLPVRTCVLIVMMMLIMLVVLLLLLLVVVATHRLSRVLHSTHAHERRLGGPRQLRRRRMCALTCASRSPSDSSCSVGRGRARLDLAQPLDDATDGERVEAVVVELVLLLGEESQHSLVVDHLLVELVVVDRLVRLGHLADRDRRLGICHVAVACVVVVVDVDCHGRR